MHEEIMTHLSASAYSNATLRRRNHVNMKTTAAHVLRVMEMNSILRSAVSGPVAKFLTGKNERRSKRMIRHRGRRIENIQSKVSQVPSYNCPMSEKNRDEDRA